MVPRLAVRVVCVGLSVTLAVSFAAGFIHLPPRTLPELCQKSNHILLLKIEKLDKEKGVIVFVMAKSLKAENSKITSFRQFIRTDSQGVKPILDWAGEGKTAVMFSVETYNGGPFQANGYVFIDEYCYSVDFNTDGQYWFMLRAEPGMSSCYTGSVDQLREAVEEILKGKEVAVPTKPPDAKQNPEDRVKDITAMEIKNRTRLEPPAANEPKPNVPQMDSGINWPNAAWIVAGISVILVMLLFCGWKIHRARKSLT